MNREAYMERIGAAPSRLQEPDVRTLESLQQAHVRQIPFETLSITGDPYGEWEGSPISLAVSDIYAKIVDGRRGGFCYELNGLFSWLLTDLGFDVRQVSARIKSDGEFGPPADHLTLVVDLDDRYLVDVGLGIPKLRRPLPMDGSPNVDDAGIGWRVVTSERPDAAYAVEYRRPDQADWATRCIFRDVHRTMSHFEATCEYFERAPDSHFTGDPIVTIATEHGHAKLSPTTLTRGVRGDVRERTVDPPEWYDLLAREFGLAVPSGPRVDGLHRTGVSEES